MNIKSKLIYITVAIFILTGCGDKGKEVQGYVVADYSYLSIPVSGNIKQIVVEQGQTVQQGEVLAILDPNPEADQVKQAAALLLQQQNQLKDLQKGKGSRTLSILEDQITQAKLKYDYSRKHYQRLKTLHEDKYVNQNDTDLAKTNEEVDKLSWQQAKESLEKAKAGARQDLILAQEAVVSSAEYKLDEIKWRLAQKTLNAPFSGTVNEIYLQPGEYATQQRPVLSMHNPEKQWVVFYVSSKQVAAMRLQQTISVKCQGCKQATKAKVSYISQQAEYMPPLIFSSMQNTKYVYEIKVNLINKIVQKAYHPGQPVSVYLTRESTKEMYTP